MVRVLSLLSMAAAMIVLADGPAPAQMIDGATAEVARAGAALPGSAPTPTRSEVREARAYSLKQARKEAVVPVPPTLEIEVLDPNVDPLGNPAVVTTGGKDGRTIVDIPPSVLVHRYYYTGERSFQGPMIPGGPTIIVVNHPRTGKRLYVETQMLPGAPRVYYGRSTIVYDYGPQAITLKFGHHGMPSVDYRQGIPFLDRVHNAAEVRHQRIDDFVQRTGIPAAGAKVRDGASHLAGATADGVRFAGQAALTPVVQVIRVTPLGSILARGPEERAGQARDVAVQRASAEARRLEADIPTVR